MRALLALLLALLAACGTAAPPPFTYVPLWPEASGGPAILDQPAPAAVARYLDGIAFTFDGCSHRFTPPQEVAANGATCCSGYARFWAEWARRQGHEAYVVAVWRGENYDMAHAFTLFRPPERGWYLASNNQLWVGFNLPDTLKAASRVGAALVFPYPVTASLAWDAEGRPVPLD